MSVTAQAQTYFSKEIITKGYKNIHRTTLETGNVKADTATNSIRIKPYKRHKKVIILNSVKHGRNGWIIDPIFDKNGAVRFELNQAYLKIEDSKRIVIYHFKMLM